MRYLGRAAAAIAVLILLVVPSARDDVVQSADEVALTGEFHWEQMSHTGDVDAHFTRSDGDEWDVEFRFEWDGEPHTYRGTAEGSLRDGSFSGRVENDSAEWPKTFHFSGLFEDGRFTGTHVAVRPGGEMQPTGTLTLGR